MSLSPILSLQTGQVPPQEDIGEMLIGDMEQMTEMVSKGLSHVSAE